MNLQDDTINNKNTTNYRIITKSKTPMTYKLFILFITIIMLLFLKFYYSYISQNTSYLIEGESKNFSYKNARFNETYNQYYFLHGDVKIKNENIDIKSVELKSDNQLIIGSSDFLHGISSESKGYGELFPRNVIENIKDWKIEVTYVLNNSEYKETIQLNVEKDAK